MLVALQRVLPQHALSRLMYHLARSRTRWLKEALIGSFMRRYAIDLSEAEFDTAEQYASFNAFFTRALKSGARPLDPRPGHIVSPCDGTISVADTLTEQRMIQAKGLDFTLPQLLAAELPGLACLQGGSYTTIYLAPYNYHRIHMPLDGELRAAWHVPGRLFSVNAATATRIPRLYARNERVVLVFDGPRFPFVMVLVGALLVGSISTVWHGQITPAKERRRPYHWLEPRLGVPTARARGAECGHFNMGSTVIVLLPRGRSRWNDDCRGGARAVVGQSLGVLLSS